MGKVKSKETKLEKRVRKILSERGIKYRKNSSKYFGKPDIIIAPQKVVIFVDSCFWHGCKKHCRMPKSNRDYWIEKINRNKKRDGLVNAYYRKNHWLIIRIWEHNLENIDKYIDKII